MSELVDLAIAAHGGMQRWEQIQTCNAQLAAMVRF